MEEQLPKMQRPLNEMIRIFAQNTEDAVKKNLVIQKIWPTEVYPGYAEKSKSTGYGANSIDARVVSADETGNVTVVMSVASYMRYVDVGVMKGLHAEDVKRNRKAKYLHRYVNTWAPERGDTHRPFFFIEARHLRRRIGQFMADFYGMKSQSAMLVEAFGTLEEIDLGL